MTHAYSESYLSDAKKHLAAMAHYGICECGIDPDEFFTLFAISGYAYQFGEGNPAIIAGRSGIELARDVLDTSYGHSVDTLPAPSHSPMRTPAYWAGWVLAHYQWASGESFGAILRTLPFSEIMSMYPIYHEMDVTQCIDELNRRRTGNVRPSNLKRMRENKGLSQSQLARASGVGLRSIQMYEQRVNDIDKAQAHTVRKLAHALNCHMEDVLESPLRS